MKDKKNVKKEYNKLKAENPYKEEYGYDFVPELNEWTNIDEQKKKAKELENM